LELPVEQLQYQLDVNVFGPFRVTQAFAPMIIESKGRIATLVRLQVFYLAQCMALIV
jgi:NAD(P)-dependent dehydrogenase (short-subunit alcohol dehydrogenase family)